MVGLEMLSSLTFVPYENSASAKGDSKLELYTAEMY